MSIRFLGAGPTLAMIFAAAAAVILAGEAHGQSDAGSLWKEISREKIEADRAELVVEILERLGDGEAGERLPVRALITDAEGRHPDGSGRGTYADGRFFAEGEFVVSLAPGEAKIAISSGPHVEPLETTLKVAAGERVKARALLRRRFHPASIGWYGGDNHVHTQHDRFVDVRVDPSYTALQARANGLNFITEADTGLADAADGRFDTPTFLYRTAPEIRPGPFVGHFNTPGIERLLPDSRLADATGRPLPGRGLKKLVHELGGALIHTHPMTPPYQLHWMGAGEAWSDAALGQGADLLDLDSPQSETLWFAMLNLGCRLGASGYTDCALGRLQTPTPGDKRVYCKADSLDYDQIVAAMRAGRTVATNGGPLFLEVTVDGREIGESIPLGAGETRSVAVHVRCWSDTPLAGVGLFCGGERIEAFDGKRRTGEIDFEARIDLAKRPADWFVARAESDGGWWAVTSPIYVDVAGERPDEPASTVILEISNHTRYVELRKDFFAHGIVTVRPAEGLAEVRLVRDDQTLQTFRPEAGDQFAEGRVPVTGAGAGGEYAPGWAWHREGDADCHVQFDWPVKDSGWYRVEAKTTTGRTIASESLRFDADDDQSRALSSARIEGPGTLVVFRGYGQEMPLREIKTPFEGDHWWYPQSNWWSMTAKFYGATRELQAGDPSSAHRFRPADE